MPKELKKEYAVAVGNGPFPFDMLRYDHCFPASESDSSEMGRAHYQHDRCVIVAKYCQQPGKWTVDRWQSFGWTLIVHSGRGFGRFEDAKYAADMFVKGCMRA